MLLHDDLMDTFKNDINKVCAKLKKAWGEAHKQTEIPFIETLAGTFTGNNVLEGFRCNTENLCNEDEKIENKYDNDIYDMFFKDSMIIFDITSDEDILIPHMSIVQLKDILFKKLKLNKACDIFMLTVEHLRYAGDDVLLSILWLLNSIIDTISVLSSPQLNTSVASVVYKGKGKPIYHHKSHR